MLIQATQQVVLPTRLITLVISIVPIATLTPHIMDLVPAVTHIITHIVQEPQVVQLDSDIIVS